MEHVAIDLGGRESQICVRSADGTILQEKRWKTDELGEYLKSRPTSRVIVETCSEGFGVADTARLLGHEVRVVAATLVRSLGVGQRGIKTDVRDARLLSEASCRMDLPSVHVASSRSRQRKSMCGMREALVAARTMLINNVRGWLRAKAIQIRRGTPSRFAERVRALVSERPSYVDRQLLSIEHLCQQIAEADKELVADAKSDETCRRMMTVPGVGPVTAVRFVAALDCAERFVSAHHVQSYLGLTPGELQSSDKRRRTGITKAGSTSARWILVQAAWCARRAKGSHPMVLWSQEVEKRRGKRVAIVALARKIAGILFAIWRDGTFYDPKHTAPLPTATN